MDKLVDTLQKEYHRWPLWIPVLIGVGIWIYFALPYEPSKNWCLLIPILIAVSCVIPQIRFPTIVLLLIVIGFSAGSLRTYMLPSKPLTHELGPLWLEGTVISCERKQTKTGGYYYRAIFNGVSSRAFKVPQQIRLTLRGKVPALFPGGRLLVHAILRPLQGPTHPGGFNFRRYNLYKGIEATGYNLAPPIKLQDKQRRGLWTWIESMRQLTTLKLQDSLPQPVGAIAAALITGDRSGVTDTTKEAFANSGLAHILAISGLHLSIVAGLVFLLIRHGGGFLHQWVNTKKLAALVTMVVTVFYLALSGFGIPAQRALLMTSLVMLAVFINRNPFSLRTVSFAATIILLYRPENLLTPSFQLSFAAVTALIAAYEAWQNPIECWIGRGGMWRWCVLYLSSTLFSSLIASLATLPFVVMTFNQFTLMGVLANLLAVPLTAFIIMPAALMWVILFALGLEPVVQTPLIWGLDILNNIAFYTASLPGALIRIPSPSLLSSALIIFGGLWLCLWLERWRYWGVSPILLGVVLVFLMPQPRIFIDGQGKLVGIRADDGEFYVTSKRKGRFQRMMWLRSLGKSAYQSLPCESSSCFVGLEGKVVEIMQEIQERDKPSDLFINLVNDSCEDSTMCISASDFKTKGAHALYIIGDKFRIESVADKDRF